MVINISVQYYDGFLPYITLLVTQGYYLRGTCYIPYVETLYLQLMKQYIINIITTMFDGELNCFCFVFAFFFW